MSFVSRPTHSVALTGFALVAALGIASCDDPARTTAGDASLSAPEASAIMGASAGAANPVLRSDLRGNPRPFVGAANPVRGLNAGGLPWMIDQQKSEARVDRNGELRINVVGLVLAEGANTGRNPVASFRGILSCLTPSADAMTVETVNLMTGTFPASEQGDARIRERLDVPDPCLAPIVFVTNPGGSWFAATGF
jgi:hypothetical protein